ncbi:MAG: transposase [Lachnospiraceae bacterium]|nr:transposase [Lachnospiraceae bacterium]
MDLKQAYGLLRKEKLSLQNEVRKLNKTIDQISSGSYEDPLKIKHLKQIRDLTWKNKSLKEDADRYRSLYSRQMRENTQLRLENQELQRLNSRLQWQNDCYKNVHSDQSATACEEAQEEIRSLKDEIARLRSLLGRNGSEAGIPTSKTPINQKKIIPNSRTVSGRKKGGQPGHKKCSMAPFSDNEITDTLDHPLDCTCPCCGGALEHVRDITKDELDYEIRTVKRRHVFKEYVCAGCGHTVRSKDDSLRSENQYGPVIQTLAMSLLDLGFVSINRTRKILSGIAPGSLSISDGYLSKLQKRYALKLRGFVDEVRQECIASPLLYWDDTNIFVNTSRACFRFYGNERVALYCAHLKKNMEGILDDNVLPRLTESNTVMHDHNSINYHDGFSFRNIECLQHLERDLQKTYNASKHQWAADMKELITGMIHKRKLLISSGADSFSDGELRAFWCRYDSLLHSGYKEYFKDCLSHFSKDENALLLRLEKYRTNYTDWLYDFSLPTTNNLSERSLRFMKSKEKISGQFQNIEHAKYFAVIRTYIETCARNGVNEYQALLRLTKGSPYSMKELNISHGGA